MPEFQYYGVDKDGKKVSGKLSANNDGDLRMILRGQGIRPLRVSKLGALQGSVNSLMKGSGKSVRVDVLLTFTRQLHVLLTSGIPLVQALDILSDQAIGRELRDVILALKERVSQGSFLWQALAQYPKTFSKMYVALIRAGESSGSMDTMLKRLGRYLEDADKMRKLLKSAMIYPVMVVLIGILIITGMLVFVVPKFEQMLKASGQELPWLTQALIDLSHFIGHNILIILGITVGLIYVTRAFLKSAEGRAIMQRVLYNFPLFGPLMQKAGVARFSRTLGTLLGSGVNLLDAIDICKTTIDHAVIEEATQKIRGAIEAGKTLGMVMNKMTVFPKMAVQMIMVGESTGHLEGMLDRVAEFYESEVETLVSGLTKLIEPIVLVVLGGAVGGILIAMYLPVFKMAGAVGELMSRELIGKSKKMIELLNMIKRVSSTKANILIIGESGTGKELVARKIHDSGPLAGKAFIPVNCGAIPESLMESEMFGHKKGSFTGAVVEKSGLFEAANGGTLFLDEVGELPLSIQVKLLRAIQERNFRKVGGTEDIKVDVRIIAATNRDLEAGVKAGTFREDLYYRLNVILIKTPSLRERKEDIPILVEHFLKKFSIGQNKPLPKVDSAVMLALENHSWPGNIRELENTMERAITLESGATISINSIPKSVLSSLPQVPEVDTSSGSHDKKTIQIPAPEFSKGAIDLDSILQGIERTYLLAALEHAGGVKKRASELLGITFRSIRYRLKKLGVSSDDDSESEKDE